MGHRQDLQNKLQTIIGARQDGKQNVFFQPPESVSLVYPCLVYKRSSGDIKYANNMPYTFTHSYEITLITKDPDSILVDKIIKSFNMIRYSRYFSTDNLNHDIFELYF